jgi:8-oxo-dGTP pyrophosphatase MutT (NUDIX family)
MAGLVARAAGLEGAAMSTTDPPADGSERRQSAVLILVGRDGDAEGEPFVVLQQRAAHLRHHPGQVAFPGGTREPTDASPVATALREAQEEVGLDPAGAEPLALLPRLLIPVSGFAVSAVLAAWTRPAPLVADPAETAAVHRVPLATFTPHDAWYDLAHGAGWTGAAIDVGGTTIWGYTADVLAALLRGEPA